MPTNIRRRGRGIPKVAPAEIADGALDTTGVDVLTGVADHVYVAHRITFHYPTDITAIDMDIKFDTIDEEGTQRDYATIADDGDITEIKAIINTWIDPNAPTNTVLCYKEFEKPLALEEGDTISIVGNDATDANNYTSTGGVSTFVTIDYEDIDANVYEQANWA
ncbi:MAG: hypothetical protein PVG65_03355 [Candidatus Thorarchaeota archaeon]|jgi:hypothetical protein